MKLITSLALIFCLVASVQGEVVTKAVDYNQGDVELEGFLAWDNSLDGKRPGVLVVHEWTGLNDYAKRRCRELAALGYIAFAVDIYGKGVRPKSVEEASRQAGIYRGDRELMRRRVTAGLEELISNELCDRDRVAAIGYCFGGGTVLEPARSGAAIAGVVSFHGNLHTPDPTDAGNIICKVLVCHGADDPHVPDQQVANFFDEMRAAGVDYQFIAYSGAVHAFTNSDAGDDPSQGASYNAGAERRSWQHMLTFFAELFE